MKKIFLFCLSALACLSAHAQISANFEEGTGSVTINLRQVANSSMTLYGIVTNPNTTVNKTGYAYKVTTTSTYAATGDAWETGLNFCFNENVSNGQYLHIAVYTTMTKIEFGDATAALAVTAGGGYVDNHTLRNIAQNTWFDLVVKMPQRNAGSDFKMQIDTRTGTENGYAYDNHDKVLYLDEIVVNNDATPRTSFQLPARIERLSFLPLISNFEGVELVSYAGVGNNIATVEVINNADNTGLNRTAKTLYVTTNNTNAGYDVGLDLIFKQSFSKSTYRYLHFVIKTDKGIKLELKPNNEWDGNKTYTNTTFGTWFDYAFDLNDHTNNTTIYNVRLCIDSREEGNRNAEFYIDEIYASSSNTPRTEILPYGVWNGSAADNDWNSLANWSNNVPPFETSDVVIPAGLANYPILNNSAPYYAPIADEITYNDCQNITIEPGAKLGNQHLLNVTGDATVNYDLTAGRWYTLATPVAATVQNFHFDKSPSTWLQSFGEGGAQWTYINRLDYPLNIGDGFAFFIGESTPQQFAVTGSLTADESTLKALAWANDGDYDFALVGNPYVTSIEVDRPYLIYTGAGYSGYNPISGNWGLTLSETINKYLAPLQSFIIEKDGDETAYTFTPAMQTTNEADAGALRSSADTSDLLRITASNTSASVSTVIAKRETGKASHKLFDSISATPDIYTLKTEEKFGVQLLQTKEAVIPVGLRTNYTGAMSFTFTGMDNYDAQIVFTDAVTGSIMDLTDLTSYTYGLDYTPAVENEENRFAVQFSPKTITGIATPMIDKVVDIQYYNLQGVCIPKVETLSLVAGNLYIVKKIYKSGKSEVSKSIIR
ncbi:MAG: hypothetical protein LBS25_02715 [Candidatus Symbiothrix sp.]|nr:hypothetical protein [Candidatus Symbiothrix sp.]